VGQRSEAVLEDGGGAVAGVDHLPRAAEVGGGEAGQGRLHQDVVRAEGGQLRLGVAPGHQGHRLVEHIDHREQFLAPAQRGADVDGDHEVDTHLPRHIHRDVVHHAAVHQQLAVHLHAG